MRVLLFGPGYVGLSLALALQEEGHEVTAVSRWAVPGLLTLQADITEAASLAALKGPFDAAINLVSSSGQERYRAVYVDGTRNILTKLEEIQVPLLLQASSTSVYAQNDGEWVDETSPTEPEAETSRALVEMEAMVLRSGRGAILRISGIYGPGRGHLFKQFLLGEAKITGKPERHLNMVHREDISSAFSLALRFAKLGEVYNLTDNEPVKQTEFYAWLASELGRPLPAIDSSDSPAKRGVTDKRVRNEKARQELGWALKYPTFREGFASEIARVRAAG